METKRLAKTIDVDTEHYDAKVEFMHHHCPTSKVCPRHGRRFVSFQLKHSSESNRKSLPSPVKILAPEY